MTGYFAAEPPPTGPLDELEQIETTLKSQTSALDFSTIFLSVENIVGQNITNSDICNKAAEVLLSFPLDDHSIRLQVLTLLEKIGEYKALRKATRHIIDTEGPTDLQVVVFGALGLLAAGRGTVAQKLFTDLPGRAITAQTLPRGLPLPQLPLWEETLRKTEFDSRRGPPNFARLERLRYRDALYQSIEKYLADDNIASDLYLNLANYYCISQNWHAAIAAYRSYIAHENAQSSQNEDNIEAARINLMDCYYYAKKHYAALETYQEIQRSRKQQEKPLYPIRPWWLNEALADKTIQLSQEDSRERFGYLVDATRHSDDRTKIMPNNMEVRVTRESNSFLYIPRLFLSPGCGQNSEKDEVGRNVAIARQPQKTNETVTGLLPSLTQFNALGAIFLGLNTKKPLYNALTAAENSKKCKEILTARYHAVCDKIKHNFSGGQQKLLLEMFGGICKKMQHYRSFKGMPAKSGLFDKTISTILKSSFVPKTVADICQPHQSFADLLFPFDVDKIKLFSEEKTSNLKTVVDSM